MCQFTVKKLQQEPPIVSAHESSSESRGLKRSYPSLSEGVASIAENGEAGQVEDGLKVWGYMPGHVHWKIGAVDDVTQRKQTALDSKRVDVVEHVLHAIPPRSITDAFVNHFLGVVNYRYSTIYAPTFTDQYVQWWADRGAGKRLSPEFTCLLLRVCAYSVQYLTPSLRKMIEFELACNLQQLTDRFSNAAEHLSRSFEASNTCIERVQEQFLKGAWLKSESKIVESWHALGCTIREAQELGIDRDANIEGLSEFDIEIRRRIWALLYIWDWQMGAWLGRPNLIDQKNLNFKLPNLRLDQSSSEPNLLSPFAHMALQASLGRRLNTIMGDAQSVDALSANEILTIEAELDKFIDELPPIFRLTDPDTSLDAEYPYFVFQRHQLHTVVYMTKLDFLKPFLTRARDDKKTDRDDEFRRMGIDLALDLLKVARRMFDHEFPINAKFHVVVFSIFDTSTILCSAIIHDYEHCLPRRDEVTNAIDGSLDMLQQLSLTTKIGATSYAFLYKLVQSHLELSRGAGNSKRARKQSSASIHTFEPPPLVHNTSSRESIATVDYPPQQSTLLPALSTTSIAMEPAHEIPLTSDPSFDLDQFLAQNSFGSAAAVDMGGMEQIWDWQDLNLDQFPY
ncbi:DNA binding [Ascochyta rabiei]|uniref:DNA binding n=2 Tax=Didymella rabiei TaxID=5454 RepID=A0A163HCS4_DIDRA|nr:DNA binding [Ascochyta rabiei]